MNLREMIIVYCKAREEAKEEAERLVARLGLRGYKASVECFYHALVEHTHEGELKEAFHADVMNECKLLSIEPERVERTVHLQYSDKDRELADLVQFVLDGNGIHDVEYDRPLEEYAAKCESCGVWHRMLPFDLRFSSLTTALDSRIGYKERELDGLRNPVEIDLSEYEQGPLDDDGLFLHMLTSYPEMGQLVDFFESKGGTVEFYPESETLPNAALSGSKESELLLRFSESCPVPEAGRRFNEHLLAFGKKHAPKLFKEAVKERRINESGVLERAMEREAVRELKSLKKSKKPLDFYEYKGQLIASKSALRKILDAGLTGLDPKPCTLDSNYFWLDTTIKLKQRLTRPGEAFGFRAERCPGCGFLWNETIFGPIRYAREDYAGEDFAIGIDNWSKLYVSKRALEFLKSIEPNFRSGYNLCFLE
jgi:hypothetical protein